MAGAARSVDLRDPLLERDFVRLASRPSFVRNRCLGALGLGAILLLVYGASRRQSDEVGLALHTIFTIAAVLITGATAAAEAAVAIPTERATGSLTVLLTVPLGSTRMAAGFLLSRILLAGYALLALLPLEGTALLMGGVDVGDLGRTLLLVATAAVYGAGAGLLAGYAAANHRLALGRTGFLTMTHWLLLPAALGILGLAFHDFEAEKAFGPYVMPAAEAFCYQAAGVLFLFSPLGALILEMIQVNRGGFPPVGLPAGVMSVDVAWIVFGTAVLLAAAAVAVTGRRLSLDFERSAVAARPGSFRALFDAFLGSRGPDLGAATPGGGASRTPVVRIGRRPLAWKESRPPRNVLARWGLHLAAAGWVVFLAWLMFHPRIRGNIQGTDVRNATAFYDILLMLPVLLYLFAATGGCASFVAEERERNALDLLRAAPIPAREYFLGRLLGIGRRLRPVAILSGILALAGGVTGRVNLFGVLALLAGFACVGLFLALLAFTLGMGCLTVRSAQRRFGGVMLVLVLGWGMGVAFLGEVVGGEFERRVIPFLLAINPFPSVGGFYSLYWNFFHDRDRDLREFGWPAACGALLWAAVAYGLWRRLPGAFDRALHRAEDR